MWITLFKGFGSHGHRIHLCPLDNTYNRIHHLSFSFSGGYILSSWRLGFIAKTKQKHHQPPSTIPYVFFFKSFHKCWNITLDMWEILHWDACKIPDFYLIDLLLSFRQWYIAKLSLPLKLGSWAVIWNKQLGLQWGAEGIFMNEVIENIWSHFIRLW